MSHTSENLIEKSRESLDEAISTEPISLYLREIGRVLLLTAEDEKKLAQKIETGKREKEIKQEYFVKYGRSPSTTETVVFILLELVHAATIFQLLQKWLGLKTDGSFKESISDTTLRKSIDNEIDQRLTQNIALKTNHTIPETEQALINLS